LNVVVYVQDNNVKFVYDESKLAVLNNIMDKWILSFVQSLVVFFEAEMAGKRTSTYFLYNQHEDVTMLV
jgi:isoleucyl-tRNA synthetase